MKDTVSWQKQILVCASRQQHISNKYSVFKQVSVTSQITPFCRGRLYDKKDHNTILKGISMKHDMHHDVQVHSQTTSNTVVFLKRKKKSNVTNFTQVFRDEIQTFENWISCF